MRLLFVGTDRDRAGGAAHFITLAKTMASAGHDVLTVVDRGSYIDQCLEAFGIARRHARFRNVLAPRAHRVLAAAIRTQRPEWLIGDFGKEYWPLIVQGRLRGIPVALFRQRVPAMKGFSEYLLPRLAQRFIAVSQFARTLFLERGMPATRVQVLYNAVDTGVFRPDPESGRQIRRAMGIPDDAVVVGYVGRMYVGKGILHLQRALDAAMQREPRLHALWIGEGPHLDMLLQAIARSGRDHRHHLGGWRAEIGRCYTAMSMLALPTTLHETFGRVSIEAQATGIPVLGSHMGGIPETMLDGVTGHLLPPEDTGTWHDAILSLCEADRRASMGRAARDFVERSFSMQVIARDFLALLQDPAAVRAPAG